MEISKEKIEYFKENGFVLLESFADEKICDDILNAVKSHIEKKVEPIETEEEYLDGNREGKTLRRLRQVYDREDVFKSWMKDLKIRPILKEFLGETPVITLAHHNSIMTKMAGVSSKTLWHQDRRYWNFENDNLVSVWLALGDEYLENGLLEFIPKSHKMSFSKEQFDEKTSFRDDLKENQELIKTRVHNRLKKGDVVIFHCKTLHYASKNSSDKDKISFVYTVRGVSNKPITSTRSDFKEIILD